MIHRYNDFKLYEKDITGIENWTTQNILETEIEARQYLKIDTSINDDVLASRKHAKDVSFKCDQIIKDRKERAKSEWEKLFD